MEKEINNNGIGAVYATFKINPDCISTIKVGDAVSLSDNNEISLGFLDERLLGRVEHISSDIATIQIRGIIRLFFEISSPKIGGRPIFRVFAYPSVGNGVVVDGEGRVIGDKNDNTLVIAVNVSEMTCDVLL